MQETKLPKHPLFRWILAQYLRFLLIPTILYTSLNINKILDVIQKNIFEILDPSLIVQPQEQTTNQTQTFVHVYQIITHIIPYISLGFTILAFMYASSFTIALIYHKTKLDSEYSILNSNNIEAYKTDFNRLTPVLFFILLGASIVYSKM